MRRRRSHSSSRPRSGGSSERTSSASRARPRSTSGASTASSSSSSKRAASAWRPGAIACSTPSDSSSASAAAAAFLVSSSTSASRSRGPPTVRTRSARAAARACSAVASSSANWNRAAYRAPRRIRVGSSRNERPCSALDRAGDEIGPAAERVAKRAERLAGEGDRHRVDREVAPDACLPQRRRPDVGERTGLGQLSARAVARSMSPTTAVPNASWTTNRSPVSRASPRATSTASPSTTMSTSTWAAPSSRSRTAPPTRYTGTSPAARASGSRSRATSGWRARSAASEVTRPRLENRGGAHARHGRSVDRGDDVDLDRDAAGERRRLDRGAGRVAARASAPCRPRSWRANSPRSARKTLAFTTLASDEPAASRIAGEVVERLVRGDGDVALAELARRVERPLAGDEYEPVGDDRLVVGRALKRCGCSLGAHNGLGHGGNRTPPCGRVNPHLTTPAGRPRARSLRIPFAGTPGP